MSKVDHALDDAKHTLDELIFRQRAAAIPAMIAAMVDWAVMHGGGDVLRNSLTNAARLIGDCERIVQKGKH